MPDLDSRDKRGSAIGIDLAWVHAYPNPDGTIGAEDREQIAWKYAFTVTATGVVPLRMLVGWGV